MTRKELIFWSLITGILSGMFYNLFNLGEPFSIGYTTFAFGMGMLIRFTFFVLFEEDRTSENAPKEKQE